ncbi:RNA-binding protein 39-like isoform X2 [Planococcus citri]|uniref:RNA-binding protein 39-like isoform X2 n=1 Tax=Planococcus citri TaxID=170843 RepID=UPI0031F8C7DB
MIVENMADDFDIEALLEAPFKKEVNGEHQPPSEPTFNDEERNGDKSEDNKFSNGVSSGGSAGGDANGSTGGSGKSKHRDRSRDRDRERRGSKTRHRSRSRHRSKSPRHRSRSKKRSRSRHRSKSSRLKSKSPKKRSKSPRNRSKSPKKRSKSPRNRSKSPKKRSKSPRNRSKSPKKRSKSPRNRSKSPKKRSKSPRNRSKSPRHLSRTKRSRSRHRSRSPRPPVGIDRDRDRDRHNFKHRSRSRSRDRRRRKKSLTPISLPGRRDPYPPYPRRPPPMSDDLTPEERDARTIFCMQLSQKIRAKDLEEFFSSVGKVRDVRLITCNKTRRFKGIAYIEFKDPESVALALGLNNQKLLGIPIIVQPTQAEKNRIGNTMPNLMPRTHPGPVRLYVGSLHYNITEDMLRGIFEPFGKIDSIMLMCDPETGRSKGYGFVTYHNSEDAKKALEQMNGFELAGRPMKVNNVTDRHEFVQTGPGIDETDERAGIDLGATGRLQLMYKLAEGTGMQIPAAAASALNLNPQPAPVIQQTAPPIATQCFLLANMFDPNAESAENWDIEIRDDVIEECNRHGGCVHVFVDKASPQGNVYVKCPTITTAVAAVNSLHGRWFGGRVITAAYVPVINYHNLFPETITASTLLAQSKKAAV